MEFMKHELFSRFSSTYFCRNDFALTLLGDTTGLASLFGYTVEEISSTFQNSLVAMIRTDARHKLQNTITEQLADTDDIECIIPVCHKNGNIVWVLNRAVRKKTNDGNTYICGILIEISKLKQEYDREKETACTLEEEAKKDSLTHIYNAYTARKLAEAFIDESPENLAALLIVDLDDFKQINDQYGHLFGDAVLIQTAKTIKNLFRSEDIVGRIGGEEFMILMKGTTDLNIITNRCLQLNETLMNMFGDQMPTCKPSCSIGVALLPNHANTYFGLFRCADRALYYAKAQGKKQYALYNSEDNNMASGNSFLRYMDYDENMLRGYIEPESSKSFFENI